MTSVEERLAAVEALLGDLASLSSVRDLLEGARAARARQAHGDELRRILELEPAAKYPAIDELSDIARRQLVAAAPDPVELVAEAPEHQRDSLRKLLSGPQQLLLQVELDFRAGLIPRRACLRVADQVPGRSWTWRPPARPITAEQAEALQPDFEDRLMITEYGACLFASYDFSSSDPGYDLPLDAIAILRTVDLELDEAIALGQVVIVPHDLEEDREAYLNDLHDTLQAEQVVGFGVLGVNTFAVSR